MRIFGGVGRWAALAVLAGTLAATAPEGAAAQFRVGVQGMYTSGSAAIIDSAWGVGGRVMVEIPRSPLEFHGIFDYHFPDCPAAAENCNSWTAGGNVYLRGGDGPAFIGGGVSLHRRDFDLAEDEELAKVEDWGFNFGIGLVLPVLPIVDPLIEFRYEFYDQVQDQFVISAGVVLF